MWGWIVGVLGAVGGILVALLSGRRPRPDTRRVEEARRQHRELQARAQDEVAEDREVEALKEEIDAPLEKKDLDELDPDELARRLSSRR